jgi:hypothetical protein
MTPQQLLNVLGTTLVTLYNIRSSQTWLEITQHQLAHPELKTNLASALIALTDLQADLEATLEILENPALVITNEMVAMLKYQPSDNFTAGQILANANKLGGWDNAVQITEAIELGRHNDLRAIAQSMDKEQITLIERVIEGGGHYR